MTNLILEEKKHEYFLDGVRIPGVTEILQDAGLSNLDGVNQDILERAAEFGKAVHKTIELYCKGTLDIESLDPALVPYLAAWKAFAEDFGYIHHKTEFQGHSPKYRFAFTIDQLGEIAKTKTPGLTLADIKTGQPYPSHKYQMGGYSLGAGKEYKNIILIYLDPSYQPRGYKVFFATNNKREQCIFLSALSLYNVKKSEGLLWQQKPNRI